MTPEERRSAILELIRESRRPVSGTLLAKTYGVSRPIIVQDIALLRAADWDIISTNRGYILLDKPVYQRVFKVNHNDEQMEDELVTMVDNGGHVKDVIVEHAVYGELKGKLDLSSRRDVKEFMERMKADQGVSLKSMTNGYHFHTVEAEDEETLDRIEQELQNKGYLVK